MNPLYDYVQSRLENIPLSSSLSTDCYSFDELCDNFKQHIQWSPVHRISLAMNLAVGFSVNMPGELIWMFLYGPASSGKTLISSLISSDKKRYFTLSKATGLYSGWRGSADKEEDESEDDDDNEENKEEKSAALVSQINNKCLVFPDFTTVMSMSPHLYAQLQGELRDVYEGKAHIHYRNNKSESYQNVNFSIIAAVTDEIHKMNLSEMGERFIKLDVADEAFRTTNFVASAIQNDVQAMMSVFSGEKMTSRRPFEVPLRAAANGYQNYLHMVFDQRSFIPTYSEKNQKRIAALAAFITDLRTKVPRTITREMIYRPRAEFPTRLAKQLNKVALALAFVMQRDVDSDVLNIVVKTAFDTGYGFPMDIAKVIYEKQRDTDIGMTSDMIATATGVPLTTIKNKVQDLQSLGILEVNKLAGNNGGRHAHYHSLNRRIFGSLHFALTGKQRL